MPLPAPALTPRPPCSTANRPGTSAPRPPRGSSRRASRATASPASAAACAQMARGVAVAAERAELPVRRPVQPLDRADEAPARRQPRRDGGEQGAQVAEIRQHVAGQHQRELPLLAGAGTPAHRPRAARRRGRAAPPPASMRGDRSTPIQGPSRQVRQRHRHQPGAAAEIEHRPRARRIGQPCARRGQAGDAVAEADQMRDRTAPRSRRTRRAHSRAAPVRYRRRGRRRRPDGAHRDPPAPA